MSVETLPILTYPDERLKTVCEPVEQFDPELREFAEHLQHTADQGPSAVGIAAPQVGRMQRLCLVDATRAKRPVDNNGPLVLVNPAITNWKGFAVGREGCLSIPDYTGKVIRAETIELTAQDIEGRTVTFKMKGFEARIAQHEIDHLDGILFLDRLVSRHADLRER